MDTYYESHIHDFSPARLTKLIPEILRLNPKPQSLLDIGCGTGNTMVAMSELLRIESPVGAENSENLIKIAEERTGHRVVKASVIEDGFGEVLGQQFDVVVLSAVLHHLVGRTRRTSKRNIARAVANARAVVKPGGLLVIHEPLFRPSVSLDLLFYMKLFVGKMARDRRVPLGSYWANIGSPLVSYMTPGELRALTGPAEYFDLEKTSMPRIARLGGVFARYDASVIVRVPG